MATSLRLGKPQRHRPDRSKELAADLSRGALAGAIAGVAGAWTMIQVAGVWSRLSGAKRTSLGTQEELDAASNVVDILTRKVLQVRLNRPQKRRAATGFHYAFGGLLGAVYGILAELSPEVTAGVGAPFGALEWLLGNKLTAPRFGLLKPRSQYSREERLQTLVAHVVFGVSTELARRSIRTELLA